MSPSEMANRQYWVGRRTDQPKAAIKISVAEFVAEANTRLQASVDFRPGTRFIASPHATHGIEGSHGVEGSPTWEGPDAMRSLIHRIVQEMTARYEIPVPFRIDKMT